MSEKIIVKETIVVEGRDDVAAVKRAVQGEVIITGGFALSKKTMDLIKTAQARNGVIIFTDPDYAGEQIRQRIAKAVPNCKHAFLSKEDAFKEGNIGVENASPQSIRLALNHVREEVFEISVNFDMSEMMSLGLVGNSLASVRRALAGEYLGIGYTNAKQFLSRINSFGITKEELNLALQEAEAKIVERLSQERNQ